MRFFFSCILHQATLYIYSEGCMHNIKSIMLSGWEVARGEWEIIFDLFFVCVSSRDGDYFLWIFSIERRINHLKIIDDTVSHSENNMQSIYLTGRTNNALICCDRFRKNQSSAFICCVTPKHRIAFPYSLIRSLRKLWASFVFHISNEIQRNILAIRSSPNHKDNVIRHFGLTRIQSDRKCFDWKFLQCHTSPTPNKNNQPKCMM